MFSKLRKKLLKNIEIPVIPITINKQSDKAQNKETKKTCFWSMPCLKTKAFWAPIAIINDSPRKKPVKNG